MAQDANRDNESAGEFSDDSAIAGWNDETVELDRLYRQALEAVDAIEQSIDSALDSPAAEETLAAFIKDASDAPPMSDSSNAATTSADILTMSARREPVSQQPRLGESCHTEAHTARATAKQVLEAALFVGGRPLSSKALTQILRSELKQDLLEDTLEAINQQYSEEGRPYEIRLTEGGWLLALRPEFERVRHRVYGLGPKEVKLSQDALEVLAVVAYHQPASVEDLAALGKPAASGVLRQLLRRELIALERGDGGSKDVRYRTTRRFLQLFNLDSLEDLPHAETIAQK